MKRKYVFRLIFSFIASIISLVASAATPEQELLDAIAKDDIKIVSRLLIDGVPHTFEDAETGTTPLMMAVGQLHTDMINLLMRQGAKPDFQTKRGDTALHHAAYSGSATIWKILLKAKPDVNITNEAGGTPLMVASHIGNLAAAKLLINAKAKIDVELPDGNTALLLAAQHEKNESGRNDVVSLLLQKKADPNHRNRENHSALYYAILNEDDKMVKTLLQHGAKFNRDAEHDRKIWDAATESENRRILSYLEAASKKEKKSNSSRTEKAIKPRLQN